MKFNLIILVVIYLLIVVSRFTHLPPKQVDKLSGDVIGGIVPHHLLVKDIIGNFFMHLPTDSIDNIMIIGPNHAELGESKITLAPDFADQSFTALESFVSSTFPHSQVVKVALKHAVTLGDCQSLAKQLASIPGHNLLIATIDFSHYLNSVQAAQNDQVVLDMINKRDYKNILSLSSDYLDSPGALVTALLYFDSRGADKIYLLDNTNSGLRGNPYAGTTSYMSMIFYGQN